MLQVLLIFGVYQPKFRLDVTALDKYAKEVRQRHPHVG